MSAEAWGGAESIDSKGVKPMEINYNNQAKFIDVGKSQINNLTLCLKELEKEKQTKPKVSRRKKKKDQSRSKQNRV